jgi:hypothetical protein
MGRQNNTIVEVNNERFELQTSTILNCDCSLQQPHGSNTNIENIKGANAQ